ncbi:MAG: MopE-related protein [Myxococcales bacterium]|nr:MopE-related protein [Myxococcales bacterium]
MSDSRRFSRLLGLSAALLVAAFDPGRATAQVKPRFVLAVDTSGSMRENLAGAETEGDGVGRVPQAGDDSARILDGVYYGCGDGSSNLVTGRTGAGFDTDGDCFPNDSKLWIAKDAIRKMIYGFGDVEWAMSRFSQYQVTGIETNANYQVDIDNGACAGAEGQCSNYDVLNYAGHCCNAGSSLCMNSYVAGSGEMLVGFPGIAGEAFAAIDNRPSLLRWIDYVETAFHQPTGSDILAVDLCDHVGGNDCELRAPKIGWTPLGGIIRDSGAYIADVRGGDSAASCRQYSIILLTDGEETCNTDPNQKAFELAFPGQPFPGNLTTPLPGTPDIRTYVVGVSIVPTSQDSLNAIAHYGGTDSARFANSPAELSATLAEIVQDSLAFEVCNGLDDDCDGEVDEDLSLVQPGSDPQPEALSCDGEANRSTAQNDQVNLRPEYNGSLLQSTALATEQVVCGKVDDTCANANTDDDCDGLVDEDDGTRVDCHGELICPVTGDPCNGLDDDCDDLFDEGDDSGAAFSACPQKCVSDVPCGRSTGACEPGFFLCDEITGALDTSTCVGEIGPGEETCDNVDNDCNGIVDDTIATAGNDLGGNPGGPTGSCCGSQCATTPVGICQQGQYECVSGYWVCDGEVLPEDRELCDLSDHDCDGNNFTCTNASCVIGPDPFLVGSVCGAGLGICTGNLYCDEAGDPPSLECDAPLPGSFEETCNDVDDDCDGDVDEEAIMGLDIDGLSGGPVGACCGSLCATTIYGICSPGDYACTNGRWQCLGEVLPGDEVCNALDDDCDDLVDNDDPDLSSSDPRLGVQCGTSRGECEPGYSVCTVEGTIACTPLQTPVDEVCDGLDNDCDGFTDEKLPDENGDGVRDVVLCGSSTGNCTQGQIACVAVSTDIDPDGYDYQCVGGNGPSIEVCDGEDNDCDGSSDECAGATDSAAYIACNTDPLGPLGAGGGDLCGDPDPPCEQGKTKCVADVDGLGNPGYICAGAVEGGPEVCNGLDDDCDTKVDEAIDPVDDPRVGVRCGDTADQVGECRVDVDGDGVPNDPDDAACGICRFGTQQCIGNAILCVGAIGKADYEVCDLTDNDCDGVVDECLDPADSTDNGGSCDPSEIPPDDPAKPNVGEDCVGADQGECSKGQLDCVEGKLVCVGGQEPGPEVCDGLDNDCNGIIDDVPGLNAPCGESEGECQPGKLVCEGSELVCLGAVAGSDEVCDGLDNDCDSKVDEGLGLGEACGTDEGICQTGKKQCVDGVIKCVGQMTPGIEVCDCVDNDCDGNVDEETGDASLCPGEAQCLMCQCALPCTMGMEFEAQCPQGKAAVTVAVGGADACYCVGEQCKRDECAAETIEVDGEVQCAPNSGSVADCVCRNNECSFVCAGRPCTDGNVCDPTDGRCKPPDCRQQQFACPEGERCQGMDGAWACVSDACASMDCGSGEACRDGVCFASCATVECDEANRCEDGSCVADPCAVTQCDSGEICDKPTGACVIPPRDGCFFGGCPEGQVCEPAGGECGEDPCLRTHCPYGQICNSETSQCELRCGGTLVYCDGECIDANTSKRFCGASADCQGSSAGSACADDEVCSRGVCKTGGCDDGWVDCQGGCIDPRTNADFCGASDDCAGENGGSKCAAGTTCVAGTCASGTDAGTAPDGTHLIASGGGGCTCSVPGGGSRLASGAPSGARGGAALGLSLFGLALLTLRRRRRRRASGLGGLRLPKLSALSLLALLVLISGLLSGCEVETFCIDCDEREAPGWSKGDGGDSLFDFGGQGRRDSGPVVVVDAGPRDAATDAKTTPPGCLDQELCDGKDNDCDGKVDEGVDPADQNIDLQSDLEHCGACGNVCAIDHAFAMCSDGACVVDRSQGENGCDVGYHDLDGEQANGCEYRCTVSAADDTICDLLDNDCDGDVDEDIDFQNDVDNCGFCGFTCSFGHAAAGGICTNGECTLDNSKCDDNWHDLDSKPINGCEFFCTLADPPVEVCNGSDDDCDGNIDEKTGDADDRIGVSCRFGADGTTVELDPAAPVGQCKNGTSVCAPGGYIGCVGEVRPTTEVCDGADNDCDGEIDTDHPDLGLPCGQVTPGSECRQGTLQIPPSTGCPAGEITQLVCLGLVLPADETCNNRDDDCDGKVDEKDPTTGYRPEENQLCLNTDSGMELVGVDPPGLCSAGRTSCDSGFLRCNGEVSPEAAELCDALDHDCDGSALNGFSDSGDGTATSGPDPRIGDPCGLTDQGECALGTYVCDLGNEALLCVGEVGPGDEVCDGKDNDCDGNIDERDKDAGNNDIPLPGEGVACITNPDDSVNTAPPAAASIGKCRTGLTVCEAGQIGCIGEQGPSPEQCDPEDWDCNGDPVNGVASTDPDVGQPCGPPNVGACKTGTTVCDTSGAVPLVVCSGALPSDKYVPPGPSGSIETACDGLDNDCDGAVDEGPAAGYDGSSCCDRVGFACCPGEDGTRVCSQGRIACQYDPGVTVPTLESCDGADNDCDTKVDEDFDTSRDLANCGGCGTACTPDAVTLHATIACIEGACAIGDCDTGYADSNATWNDGCELACTFTGAERCDGADNDCNGTPDDVDPASLPDEVCLAKNTGVCFGADLSGALKCQSASIVCDIAGLPSPPVDYEVDETRCDGLDNDCDGYIDEAFPALGQFCYAGDGGCRNVGTIQCNGVGATSCQDADQNPVVAGAGSAESCNGMDDDCDGIADNFADPATAAVGNFMYVDLGAAAGNVLVMAYEASLPTLQSNDPGVTLSGQPCSVSGVQPAASIDWNDASAACCKLNDSGVCAIDGSGWRLCDASTFQLACEAETALCDWGYNDPGADGAVCAHAPDVTSYQNVCLGTEALASGLTTCAGGDAECATITGDPDYSDCYSQWTDGNIHDMSGNLQEWTNTEAAAGQYEIRGGSYNDVEGGRACGFDFSVAPDTFKFPNTGFRCCYYP